MPEGIRQYLLNGWEDLTIYTFHLTKSHFYLDLNLWQVKTSKTLLNGISKFLFLHLHPPSPQYPGISIPRIWLWGTFVSAIRYIYMYVEREYVCALGVFMKKNVVF